MPITAFLDALGEKPVKAFQNMKLYYALYRDDTEPMFVIDEKTNRWYDHATERGGGPISFVEWFYDLDYVHIGTKIGELYESEDPEISPILLWDNEEDSIVCSISAFLSENELVKMAENVEKIYLN